ncbi:MAG: M20/M25/M40 family metallo-hydrolase [Terriglobales bacterium]
MNRHIRALMRILLAVTVLAIIFPAVLAAQNPEPVDLEMVTRIRQEGFRNSKVMETVRELTDRFGARLTGSPNLKRANEWARDQLAKWGLANAHLESYNFGRGWAEEFTSVRMVTPDVVMLNAIPKAWTPGTNGVVRGKAVKIRAENPEDLEPYRGKLAGKIVLLGEVRESNPETEPVFSRFTDQRLQEIYEYEMPPDAFAGRYSPEEIAKRYRMVKVISEFMAQEKAAAVIQPSHFEGGALTSSGASAYKPEEPLGVPSLNMAVEHYGRISRLLDRNVDVELELDVRTHFYDNDPMAYNTIAEIPGTGSQREVVMAGAHLDSWHGGTGATDNAAGVAVAMEAVRILKALGVKPRRTIRIALWSGEEQGLRGSRAYVSEHLAVRPEPTDPRQKALPEYLRSSAGPLQFKPEYNKVSAYFNLDNGTGKLRGIYAQENAAVRPIFEAWIAPFRDLGVTTVSLRNSSGSDHQSFNSVGVPGFQFIQDPADYFTRSHHTNLDTYERVQRADLMQASVLLASFLYHTAMREQMLPRQPLLGEGYNQFDPMPPGYPHPRR